MLFFKWSNLMPRKTNKASKATSSEKKHSAVPPKATASVAKPQQPVVAVVPTPVVAVVPTIDYAAVQRAIAGLRDVDADTARDAATSLGLLGDTSVVEQLIEVVRNSNGYFHSVVRAAGASSLGQLKDRRAVEALLAAVNDPIAEPSIEAIRALAALSDPRAVSTLIEVVRNRNGFFVTSVRRAAVLGLIKLGGAEAEAEIRVTAANEWEDSVIREEATAAISKR
jgi:HEAT repeat protein